MAITRVSGTSFTNLQKFDNFATDFGAVTGNYVALQTYTVDSGGATSITFSSIPQNYTHLQIRGIAKGSGALRIRFNGDSTSTYNNHYLEGSGATVVAGYDTNAFITVYSAISGTANVFAGTVLDILDYTNTNKYKTTRSLSGLDVNGTGGYVDFDSGLWRSTSAISSIEIYNSAAANFSQYTQFALYGIAG